MERPRHVALSRGLWLFALLQAGQGCASCWYHLRRESDPSALSADVCLALLNFAYGYAACLTTPGQTVPKVLANLLNVLSAYAYTAAARSPGHYDVHHSVWHVLNGASAYTVASRAPGLSLR